MTITDYESRCVAEDAALERNSRLFFACGDLHNFGGTHYALRFGGGPEWPESFGDGDGIGEGDGIGGDCSQLTNDIAYSMKMLEVPSGVGVGANADGDGNGFGIFDGSSDYW